MTPTTSPDFPRLLPTDIIEMSSGAGADLTATMQQEGGKGGGGRRKRMEQEKLGESVPDDMPLATCHLSHAASSSSLQLRWEGQTGRVARQREKQERGGGTEGDIQGYWMLEGVTG